MPSRAKVQFVAITVVMALVAVATAPHVSRAFAQPPVLSDSLDVVNVVNAYDRALSTGDSAAALALLSSDAVILESGGVESRDDYRAHHLPADLEFARAVPSQNSTVNVRVRGDVAWAWSTSVTQGEFRGRQINSAGAELMVLTRTSAGWKISAIHWSSRQRR